MQNKRKKLIKRIAGAVTLIYAMVFSVVSVMADDATAGVEEVTSGINVLTTLVYSAISGVGAIFLAWGLLDFGTAYSAHDSTQQAQAIKKVIGGVIIIAIPAIIDLLT